MHTEVQAIMSTKGREQPVSCNAVLYRFVFKGKTSFTTVFLLCVAFMLSSVHLAFAYDGEAAAPPAIDEPENVASIETIAVEEPELEPAATDNEFPSDAVSSAGETGEDAAAPPILDTATEEVSETEIAAPAAAEFASTTVETEPVEDSPSVAETADEEAGTDNSEEESELPAVPEPSPPVLESATDLDDTEASTTTEATSTPVQVDTLTNDANYYQFSRGECVRVADGSFYCGGIENKKEVAAEDGLFAAPDSDGDLEIFLRFDGAETKITDNTVDDAAPYYDSHSDTIVWHRLVNDRYQIIAYDIAKATELQLTTGNENSMEPSRYGDRTVWQAWIANNWEILLQNGSVTQRLTESPEHDIAPLLYESYVLWNTTDANGVQQIAMYDIESGETTLIKDEDGAAVRNPRMVLVYETANENGDIMTKGFDLESKTLVPLSATPKPAPKEIPESDQTGETRALIQNKSSGKELEIVDIAPEPAAGSTGTTTPPAAEAASTTPAVSSTVGTSSTALSTTTNAATNEGDVVVPVYQPPQSAEAPQVDPATLIQDVVIPPFSASSTD